jgi:hypothetical protein
VRERRAGCANTQRDELRGLHISVPVRCRFPRDSPRWECQGSAVGVIVKIERSGCVGAAEACTQALSTRMPSQKRKGGIVLFDYEPSAAANKETCLFYFF